jgi:hypothetical protein
MEKATAKKNGRKRVSGEDSEKAQGNSGDWGTLWRRTTVSEDAPGLPQSLQCLVHMLSASIKVVSSHSESIDTI